MKHKNTIVPALFLAVSVATLFTIYSVRAGIVDDIVYRDYSSQLPLFIVFYVIAVVLNALYLAKINQFRMMSALIIMLTSTILWSVPFLVMYIF